MSYPPNCGKLQQVSAALAMRHELADALPAAFRQTRDTAKVIAFRAGVSKRTIDAARRQEHVISAPALLALAKQYPPIRALVLRLIGVTEENPSEVLDQIHKLLARVKA